MKKLIPAIVLLLISAMIMATASYAWFSMNNTVTATGMQVKATAEGGIEIQYNVSTTSDDVTYLNEATAGMTSATVLRPTSTAATGSGSAITAKWVHASASVSNDEAAKTGTYVDLTAQAGWSDGVITNEPTTAYDGNYYLVKLFNIRSTSADALAKDLRVKAVTVTGSTGTPNLDKALRVAVIAGDKSVIYAPLGGDTTNTVATAISAGIPSTTATVTNLAADSVGNLFATAGTTIPAKNGSKCGGIDVRVYIYFEGEDSHLYTDNIYCDFCRHS